MANCDSLDLKLILSFAQSYKELYQRGKINEDQLRQVLDLIDNYQNFNPDEFTAELKKIFPNSSF
ncbi:hypothetical protein LJ207_05015 [Halanaerobium sp. Z-7514]|uniref:Uncharacterized protein n=1 Tax=Halanaerobium polyolivorans TaxID=2886943 RepID=A0AAW4WXF5_9FIRM|nr:hypothetical protein [Halanaerobium polyolivorans]MCC3144686.1 hypothetical protein [Halanaerobium polyolivorans]RQD79038.1 MAG: hypothetical protein D5S01_00510 [Halanaerobium sp. MSAO_Bac5]